MDDSRCGSEEEAQRFLSLVEEHMQRREQAQQQPTSPIYPLRPTHSVLSFFSGFREQLEEQQHMVDRSKRRIREAQERAAAKRREEEARKREEQEKKEREAKELAERARQKEEQRKQKRKNDWSGAWKRYENGWKSVDTDNRSGSEIPWPTKSGLRRDLSESSVRQFLRRTAFVYSSNDHAEELFQVMTKETKRWHSDKIQHRFGRDIFQSQYREDIDMVTKLIVVSWKEAKMGRGGNK